ncbi:MAG: hypothetical protein HOQ43_22175 [Glycomyces artemisiae]|uniref:Uncharacterized protein n=1 Tax=Glycomyces artemisiae TaxID=1076443 RepID=A0A850CGE1_9ACTN|nr:hypothetical protein [Glycomyces artemisiae]
MGSSGLNWGAVGAIAGVVGVVIAYVALQDQRERDQDPGGQDATTFTEDLGDPVADGTSEWTAVDSYRVALDATFGEGRCWTDEIDLDDGGAVTEAEVNGPYNDSMDLTWYSCMDEYGTLYGRVGQSATVDSGGTANLDACLASIYTDTYLELRFDPDSPTAAEGCVYTGGDTWATVTVAATGTDGTFSTGSIYVTVWRRA